MHCNLKKYPFDHEELCVHPSNNAFTKVETDNGHEKALVEVGHKDLIDGMKPWENGITWTMEKKL